MENQLPHFVAVSPNLWTSGQPAPADFPFLKASGVELVINLAAPGATDYNSDEAQLVLENGMRYVHLPVIWKAPAVADFRSFIALMEASREQKVLVHCAKNMRVSAFVYLYQILVERETETSARARMQQIWEPDEVWSEFLQRAQREWKKRN